MVCWAPGVTQVATFPYSIVKEPMWILAQGHDQRKPALDEWPSAPVSGGVPSLELTAHIPDDLARRRAVCPKERPPDLERIWNGQRAAAISGFGLAPEQFPECRHSPWGFTVGIVPKSVVAAAMWLSQGLSLASRFGVQRSKIETTADSRRSGADFEAAIQVVGVIASV